MIGKLHGIVLDGSDPDGVARFRVFADPVGHPVGLVLP
jgi:hypothetical protein